MSDSLFDTNSRDEVNSSNQSHSHVDGKADAGVDILGLGPDVNSQEGRQNRGGSEHELGRC